MHDAKIALSPLEMQLVSDPGWILTKNQIIRKTTLLLDQLRQELYPQVMAGEWFPPEALQPAPKISKGENYRGLPYLVLDYPRMFTKDHVLAARFLFWWGHEFSLTYHFKGSYAEHYREPVIRNLDYFRAHHFYVCVSDKEWDHYFEDDNYVAMAGLASSELESIIRNKSFLKIATRFPLGQWDHIARLMADCFLETNRYLNR